MIAPRAFYVTDAADADGASLGLAPAPAPPGAETLRVFLDPLARADYVAIGREGRAVILIGAAYSTRVPERSNAEICEELLARLIEGGRDAALAAADDLVGRFLCFLVEIGRLTAFNDAGATRPVFWTRASGRLHLASHTPLLERRLGLANLDALYAHYRFGQPGFRTRLEGVRLLPPNFALDGGTGRLERFWPREPRRERAVDAALVEEAVAALDGAAAAIRARQPILLSLTAGLDSRVSATILRGSPGLQTFTYERGPIDAADIAGARALAAALGLPHRTVRVRGDRRRGPLDYRHVPELYGAYAEAFQGTDAVHVRSNLAEIGRAFWRKTTPHRRMTPRALWSTIRRPNAEGDETSAKAYAEEGYAEMLEIAGYDGVGTSAPSLLGYDAWDLFYWEGRMAGWHGPLTLGSDHVFDTQILFNSRRFLGMLLTAPFEDRLASTVFRRIVERRAPEVATFPVA